MSKNRRTKLEMACDLAERIYRYGETGQRLILEAFITNLHHFMSMTRAQLTAKWDEEFSGD